MGDRCYLEITMRGRDRARFAPHVGASPDEEWWDEEYDADAEGLVSFGIYEANYAWYDEREAAARDGIPFIGTHSEGGCYGSCAFVSFDGEQLEAPLNHDGDLVIAVDEELKPVEPVSELEAYVKKLRAVRTLFGIAKDDDAGVAEQAA